MLIIMAEFSREVMGDIFHVFFDFIFTDMCIVICGSITPTFLVTFAWPLLGV